MPKRKCTFTDELLRKYTVYQPSAGDLTAHMDTEKHKKAVRGESSLAKLTAFFVKPGKTENAVNAAEAALAFHTVRHHHSYRSMDCTSVLLKTAFPDSDTAKKLSSARTKTEAIVNGVIAPHSVELFIYLSTKT